MSAQIFTRIYNKQINDFVDLHDRHFDGDINKVKKDLKNQTIYWKKFLEQLQTDIINSEYDFDKLMNWADQFENFLAINDHFPSIEQTACLSSMSSFNHHHVLPNYTNNSKQLLDFWGYPNPDLNIILNGHNPTVSNKFIDIMVEPKSLDLKEFKLIRIQTQDDNGTSIFTDIKVRNFDRKKFLFDILTLPEFWRNFHFVSRKKKTAGAYTHPAYEINKCLNSFYTPDNSFIIGNILGKNKKEIFENVKTRTPLSLYINSFAMHLFFTQPGIILPLTAREKEWSKNATPEMTITISENEVNLITIDYSKDSKINKSTLEEFSESFSEREQSFAKFFELGKYSGGQYLLTTSEEFAFVYETNMIELFDSLSKLDKHTNI